ARPTFGSCCLLGPVVMRTNDIAAVVGAVGEEIIGKEGRHPRARRVVLLQEARERPPRHGLQKTVSALVACRTGVGENLGCVLTGFKVFLGLSRPYSAVADETLHRRESKRSAQHWLF